MSDNPADSLRRELEAALAGMFKEPGEVVFWLMPIVIAALEAARADERERLLDELDVWADETGDVADSGWRALGLNELFGKLNALRSAVSDGD